MIDVERHTAFLVSRLRALGVEVADPVDGAASGSLRLSATAFESLGEPFYAELARFYTLGHARLKFFDPPALFDLPALDVARVRARGDIESLLRRAWTAHVRSLRDARTRFERLGARVRVGGRGARLLLGVPGLEGPAAIVRGPEEILLPSAGGLARASASGPAARRFRPLRGIESASELELAIAQALEGAAAVSTRPAAAPVACVAQSAAPSLRRVLVVEGDAARLSAAQTALAALGLEVEALQDPRRALESFRARSFDGVVSGLHLSRMDGFELAARLRELPGIESLPVVVLGDAENDAHQRSARELGVEYRVRPDGWTRAGDELYALLAHSEKRRFRRFGLRLGVRAQSAGADGDLAEEVGRLGIRLCTRRDLYPGAVETYTIALPRPLAAVRVEGEICYRVAVVGKASVLAGVRFRRFFDEGEAGWLRMIDALAARESATARKPLA
jgi:CheY-like chemotaxis protein